MLKPEEWTIIKVMGSPRKLPKKNRIIIYSLLIFLFIGCAKQKQTIIDYGEIFEFGNELMGSVWIGQRTKKADYYFETTDIVMTFMNEHSVEILEWEKREYGVNYKYDYEIFENENIACIYRTEVEFDDPSDNYSYKQVRREYPAIINEEKDTMTFSNWFRDESIILKKRLDLSGREDKIIINGTYYENSDYFARIEYKLLSDSVHGLNLLITSGENTISRVVKESGSNPGYKRIILSFPEDNVRKYEAEILRNSIFDYTRTGTYSDEDKEEYLKKYGYQEISYVWAMLNQNHTGKVFAESNLVKFK